MLPLDDGLISKGIFYIKPVWNIDFVNRLIAVYQAKHNVSYAAIVFIHSSKPSKESTKREEKPILMQKKIKAADTEEACINTPSCLRLKNNEL